MDVIAKGERAVAVKNYLDTHLEARKSTIMERAIGHLETGTLTPEIAIATIGSLRELLRLKQKLSSDIRLGQKAMEATVTH